MELGQILKNARTDAGISQNELAQRIGVSRQTVSNWENGRSYPDIGSLIKLSNLYGLSLDALLKQDDHIPAHFENQAAKRKQACQIALEVGILVQLLGIALVGHEFTAFGQLLNAFGALLAWISIIGHLRYFDHSVQEVRYGIAGLSIQLLCAAAVVIWPQLARDWLFRLVHLGGAVLLWQSGVWQMFWKSPRVWVYLALIAVIPLINMSLNLKEAGSFNEVNPFQHIYRVSQVLHQEDETADDGIKIHLSSVLGIENRMALTRYCEDYEKIGTFTYTEPIPGQTDQGIWQLIPDAEPEALYKLRVDEQGRILLSCTRSGQLQYEWELEAVDTARGGIQTVGKSISIQPEWYPEGSADPEPSFKLVHVAGTATMNLGINGLEGDTLTVTEEYHHGSSLEYSTYTLSRNDRGSFTLELATRYDGVAEYALYRIPYRDGEYRFTLTFGK